METATYEYNGEEYRFYSFVSVARGLEFSGRETITHDGVVVKVIDLYSGEELHTLIASDWESGLDTALIKTLPIARMDLAFAY